MKAKLFIVLFFSVLVSGFCQNTPNTTTSGDALISYLETAEKEKNLELIRQIFDEDATILHPDGLPIAGKDAIISLYEYLWAHTQVETVKYQTDSAYNENNLHIEVGRSVFIGSNKIQDTIPFKATFVPSEGGYKISQLALGNKVTMESRLPKLIEPTGEYKIGQSIYFFDKQNTKSNRILAFQVWYPAKPGKQEKAQYQYEEVAKASAEFLGLPLFFNSYASLIESNSYLNAPGFTNQKFPVLLYNHGYSGFSSVYQTVFEDLASHGYIVVSIGHENESALLIVEDGIIITTDPENEFYKSRAGELNGEEVNSLQDILLNSDDPNENKTAYEALIKLSPLHNESTRLWAQDTKQVIEKLKELNTSYPRLKGLFDLESIGVFGHSVGGATAGQLAFDCDEIRAGINLDGFQFGDLIHHRLKIPFMFVSSNRNGDSYLRASSIIEHSDTICIQSVIKGFSHGSFSDLELFKPGGEKVIELQRDLIRTFFDKYLKSGNLQLLELENRYPEIILK